MLRRRSYALLYYGVDVKSYLTHFPLFRESSNAAVESGGTLLVSEHVRVVVDRLMASWSAYYWWSRAGVQTRLRACPYTCAYYWRCRLCLHGLNRLPS